MSWADIGYISDIPERGSRLVKTPLGCVAVFRTGPDEVFAISDSCPHKGGPLSEGIVHGRAVTCPLHNRVFSLETGMAQGADESSAPTFSVRIEGGRLLLDISALKGASAA